MLLLVELSLVDYIYIGYDSSNRKTSMVKDTLVLCTNANSACHPYGVGLMSSSPTGYGVKA